MFLRQGEILVGEGQSIQGMDTESQEVCQLQ